MASPRVLILRAPGTNCDAETAHAFLLAGATTQAFHVQRLMEQPDLIDGFQLLCIPGGFSYGDDLMAGRILGNQLRLRLAEACQRFRDAGKLILGICNGFQVLAKAGLLDIDGPAGPFATLARNHSGRYEARWVTLRATPGPCVFLKGIETIELPVAHAEGRFTTETPEQLADLQRAGRVVLRYADRDGGDNPSYPENPNGSPGHVAGVCDATGRVFGLMPHPERFVDFTQHPNWTRQPRQQEAGQGLRLFQNAVDYFA